LPTYWSNALADYRHWAGPTNCLKFKLKKIIQVPLPRYPKQILKEEDHVAAKMGELVLGWFFCLGLRKGLDCVAMRLGAVAKVTEEKVSCR
jgi:hypothetical protein